MSEERNMEYTFEVVKAVVADILKIEGEDINLETRFIED